MHVSLTTVDLAEIVQELADSPEIWWPRVQRASGQRWYVPLLIDDLFEAWLQGWPVGEGISLHDHGDSSGAFIVVEGTILETYVGRSRWVRRGARLRHRRLTEGSRITFGPEHIHDMVNGGQRQALSIHAYSPRLRTMTFYENRPGAGLVATHTEDAHPDIVLV